MSDESKKSADEGRSVSHAAPGGAGGGADPARDLLGELAARGPGQRGPGKRSAEFVAKIANAYGMLPGDLLAATLMDGLREHLAGGGKPSEYLQERARTLASTLSINRGEAMGILVGLAKELMPYVHQKQPIAIDVDQRSIVFAAVTSDGLVAAPGSGRRDLRPADVRAPISPMNTAPAIERSDADGRTPEASGLKGHEE